MLRFVTGFLLISVAGALAFKASPAPYYLQSKQVRLYQAWSADIQKLKRKDQFRDLFSQISDVEVLFTDPQVAEEFKNFTPPVRKKTSHGYTLRVGITRWIDKNSYGFIVQHELFDSDDEKIHEFGRTYKIGFIL